MDENLDKLIIATDAELLKQAANHPLIAEALQLFSGKIIAVIPVSDPVSDPENDKKTTELSDHPKSTSTPTAEPIRRDEQSGNFKALYTDIFLSAFSSLGPSVKKEKKAGYRKLAEHRRRSGAERGAQGTIEGRGEYVSRPPRPQADSKGQRRDWDLSISISKRRGRTTDWDSGLSLHQAVWDKVYQYLYHWSRRNGLTMLPPSRTIARGKAWVPHSPLDKAQWKANNYRDPYKYCDRVEGAGRYHIHAMIRFSGPLTVRQQRALIKHIRGIADSAAGRTLSRKAVKFVPVRSLQAYQNYLRKNAEKTIRTGKRIRLTAGLRAPKKSQPIANPVPEPLSTDKNVAIEPWRQPTPRYLDAAYVLVSPANASWEPIRRHDLFPWPSGPGPPKGMMEKEQTVSIEELIISNIYTQEALINILVKKGLITKEELIEEIKRLKKEIPKAKY